jgi:hypothetical protein
VGTHLRLESQQQLIHEYELQLRQVEAEKARTLTGQQKKVIKIAAKLGDRRDEAAGGHMEQKYTLMDQTV